MLRIINTVGELTDKPNFFKCIVVDVSDANKVEFEVTLSKEEKELISAINSLQSGASLYAPVVNELWSRIQSYGQMKYNIGKNETND